MFFWSRRTGVKLHFIQPGKPTQNAFVESFNGKFRDTCLNQHWFLDLADARPTIDAFTAHYNDIRPHSSLNYQPRLCSLGRRPDMILFPQWNRTDYGGKVTSTIQRCDQNTLAGLIINSKIITDLCPALLSIQRVMLQNSGRIT
jgi:putative transposase